MPPDEAKQGEMKMASMTVLGVGLVLVIAIALTWALFYTKTF